MHRPRLAALVLLMLVATGCRNAPGDDLSGKTDPKKLVELVSIRAISTSIGPVVVGEVQNRTRKPVQDVKITAILKDESGKTVLQESGFVLTNVVPASSKAPFSIPFTVGKTAFKTVEARLEAQPGGEDRSVRLEIAERRGRRVGPIYEVSGTARNPGSAPVTFPKVVATFYDKDGGVVGAETGFVDQDTLAPGQTGKFVMSVSERNNLISRFSLISEGTVERPPPPA